jgi:hypothetical protein
MVPVTEIDSKWQSPAARVWLGILFVAGGNALLFALLFFIGIRGDTLFHVILVITACGIGFLQWLYVLPIVRMLRPTHEIMARAMLRTAGVLTAVNVIFFLLLRSVLRTPVL